MYVIYCIQIIWVPKTQRLFQHDDTKSSPRHQATAAHDLPGAILQGGAWRIAIPSGIERSKEITKIYCKQIKGSNKKKH